MEKDLTRKEVRNSKILQSFKRRENKVEHEESVFSKKGEVEIKARLNLGDFAHATNREETRVFCLEKSSLHIYDGREVSKNEKIRTVTTNHIPMLVQNL